jgi:hypothetical protein
MWVESCIFISLTVKKKTLLTPNVCSINWLSWTGRRIKLGTMMAHKQAKITPFRISSNACALGTFICTSIDEGVLEKHFVKVSPKRHEGQVPFSRTLFI